MKFDIWEFIEKLHPLNGLSLDLIVEHFLQSTTTQWIFIKFDIWVFKFVEKIQVSFIKIWQTHVHLRYLAELFYKWELLQTEAVEKIKNTSISVTFTPGKKTAFLREQWLRERATILRLYVQCLSCQTPTFISVLKKKEEGKGGLCPKTERLTLPCSISKMLFSVNFPSTSRSGGFPSDVLPEITRTSTTRAALPAYNISTMRILQAMRLFSPLLLHAHAVHTYSSVHCPQSAYDYTFTPIQNRR